MRPFDEEKQISILILQQSGVVYQKISDAQFKVEYVLGRGRLSTICSQIILQYFGHTARRDGEKLIVLGNIWGKSPRGRSPSGRLIK